MSVECSVCEWDARAGHAPDCKFNPIHELRAQVEWLRAALDLSEDTGGMLVEELARKGAEIDQLRATLDALVTALDDSAWYPPAPSVASPRDAAAKLLGR